MKASLAVRYAFHCWENSYSYDLVRSIPAYRKQCGIGLELTWGRAGSCTANSF
jgi:hypothetical protein